MNQKSLLIIQGISLDGYLDPSLPAADWLAEDARKLKIDVYQLT